MGGVANISGVDRALLTKAVKTVKKHVPSRFCGLNVAQYRALKAAYTPDKVTGLLPDLNVISFANGVGKSSLLVLDMIGWTMGYEYLNYGAYPPCAIAFYASLAELRDSGMLSLRLVCAGDDMKDGGSVNMLLREFFPMARLSGIDQMRCYREIRIPHPTKSGVVNVVAVKTFDQSVVKHSGSTCHRVWINEPLPEELVGETLGRIRSKKGQLQGSIMLCATLLDGANWVQELDENSARVSLARGHMYENCFGADVTDEMAAEVKRTIGVTLVKNPQGAGYITNGVLSKSSIDGIIQHLKETRPHELEARVSGAPISGGGKIYPTFKRDIHVINDYKPNPQFPVVMVVDPHAARPSFAIWAQITSMNRIVIFREWPSTADGFPYYETIDEKAYTVGQECEVWSKIEREYDLTNSNITRIGDPNRMADHNFYTNQSIRSLYAKHGFNFNINVIDNLDVGHARVSESLYYDEIRLAANPNDIGAMPRLLVCRSCANVIRSLENYSMKKVSRRPGAPISENVNQKFKDAADTVRYLAMWHSGNSFSAVNDKAATSSDYKKFTLGRIPKAYRPQSNGFNFNGRRRVA
jgi:hypothetical protein